MSLRGVLKPDAMRDAYDRDYAAAEHLRLALDVLRDLQATGFEASRVQQAAAHLEDELDAITARWR